MRTYLAITFDVPDELADLAAWLLASGIEGRLQLQLHKLIWGAETRGV